MQTSPDASCRCEVAIVGGGAAGYFTAANLQLRSTQTRAMLFEGSSRPLAKVKISGGGRCNVTHHQFDPAILVEHYPRGFRELRGPFSRFQPEHMIEWLRARGVETKTEADGRMFPISDDSGEIVRVLTTASDRAGVECCTGHRLRSVKRRGSGSGFHLEFQNGTSCDCRYLVLTTGSHASGHRFAEALGHKVVPAVPSLFTLNICDPRIEGLAGMAFPRATIRWKAGAKRFEQSGPLLITHWGLSGPAILKLSAWAARELAQCQYRGVLEVDLLPEVDREWIEQRWSHLRQTQGSRQLANTPLESVPRRYWKQLTEFLGLGSKKASQLSRTQQESIFDQLKHGRFEFDGKSTHKDEFVTAGGVEIREIDLKTMQSQCTPGLYFAGEIMNVDGVTGGFNFQFAWTSGYLCATDLNARLGGAHS